MKHDHLDDMCSSMASFTKQDGLCCECGLAADACPRLLAQGLLRAGAVENRYRCCFAPNSFEAGPQVGGWSCVCNDDGSESACECSTLDVVMHSSRGADRFL